MIETVIVVLHLLVAIAVVGLVLMQQGKGADADRFGVARKGGREGGAFHGRICAHLGPRCGVRRLDTRRGMRDQCAR